MTMQRLCYSRIRTYKYRVQEAWAVPTALRLTNSVRVSDGWVQIFSDGTLTFRAGYCWDGPSGPTIDTRNWMRASLAHDGLYQLLREQLLAEAGAHDDLRRYADELMHGMLIEDGMSRARARMSYLGVRLFGGRAARPRRTQEAICVGRSQASDSTGTMAP